MYTFPCSLAMHKILITAMRQATASITSTGLASPAQYSLACRQCAYDTPGPVYGRHGVTLHLQLACRPSPCLLLRLHKHNAKCMTLSFMWWVQLVSKTKVHTLFTTPHSNDPTWKAVRKALNPAFSPDAIRRVYILAIMTGCVLQARFHSSTKLMLAKELQLRRHHLASSNHDVWWKLGA